MMMMMMMMIWIIWKMEMRKLCREISHMYWGRHFSLYKRIKKHWLMSKCCDKLGIIHQIDSKKGLDHFVNYSSQNARIYLNMQVDIKKTKLNDLVINTLQNYYDMSIR